MIALFIFKDIFLYTNLVFSSDFMKKQDKLQEQSQIKNIKNSTKFLKYHKLFCKVDLMIYLLLNHMQIIPIYRYISLLYQCEFKL